MGHLKSRGVRITATSIYTQFQGLMAFILVLGDFLLVLGALVLVLLVPLVLGDFLLVLGALVLVLLVPLVLGYLALHST